MTSANLANLINIRPLWLATAIIWTLVWKGLALWRSARLGQRKWFIALLVVNTLGILEIIYLLLVSRDCKVEVVEE